MIGAYYNLLVASTYGSGAYDTGVYNGSNATSGGSLSNTGLAIAVIATIAAVTLLVAIVVRIWRRPKD